MAELVAPEEGAHRIERGGDRGGGGERDGAPLHCRLAHDCRASGEETDYPQPLEVAVRVAAVAAVERVGLQWRQAVAAAVRMTRGSVGKRR